MSSTLASPVSPTSPTRFDSSQIFALVIGINKYNCEEYPNLSAATKDANAFENFLLTRMAVPKANIVNLRDDQATRDGILAGFTALRDNVNIRKDEAAIVIYYAGHGARVDKPEEWEDWATSGGQIEMMCPCDIGTVASGKGSEEEMVNGIPDRTISVLLNHLSDVKGDNITLILDCCSSAGINRSSTTPTPIQEGLVPRRITNAPRMPAGCDRRIWSRGSGTRSIGVAQGFSGKFHASHVLLAACGRDQSAYEDPKTGSGLFTQALLKILGGHDIEDLTYTSLMHKLNMPTWQTPHCEGQSIQRRLFNKRAVGADGAFLLCKRSSKEKTITLQAGAAQGITLNSRFTAHASNLIPDQTHFNPELGNLVAVSVDAFTSELTVPEDVPMFKPPRLFYCKLTERGSGKLPIYCEDRTWLESVFTLDFQKSLSVTLVDSPFEAGLLLSIESSEVKFARNDVLVTPHIGAKFPHSVPKGQGHTIRNIAKSYLHFTNHLTRTGDDFRNVWMELKALKTEFSDDFDQILTPIGENMIEDEPATVVVDEMARLGMMINNQTDLPLYPYLFYFDPSDLMIIEWYTPPIGAGSGTKTSLIDAPLPPKSELTIGYGDGGVPPWQFLLREGDTKDVGFFKLFLTTSPTSFSSIAQESPFETGSISRYGKPAKPEGLETEKWGTKLSTIIQVSK
ncbi:caspase domain-containing protein [Crucibulum laeve]|uniref:Caspase domain-containing protein n=1 Tax=Crucibulum laeve TaxID=68775 RepID=A0A5C3LE86_9AGAR|nr:caspase domain-containing protein [Crucibulum laeve]